MAKSRTSFEWSLGKVTVRGTGTEWAETKVHYMAAPGTLGPVLCGWSGGVRAGDAPQDATVTCAECRAIVAMFDRLRKKAPLRPPDPLCNMCGYPLSEHDRRDGYTRGNCVGFQ